MKPTILYIITQDMWGGAQRYIYDLVTELYHQYHICIAIGENPAAHGLEEKILEFTSKNPSATITLYRLQHLKRSISPLSDFRAIGEIRALCKKIKPAVVHLNSSKAGFLGGLALIRMKVPVIYTVHGWVFNEPTSRLRSVFYLLSEKMTVYCKDRFIVLSEEDQQEALDHLYIPEYKLSLIPLGISLHETTFARSQARQKLDIVEDSITHIGVIANFYPTKGLDILLDALHILSSQELKQAYHVHIIGEGQQRKELEKQIQQHHLEKVVTLHGFIPHAESLIRAFDLFIIPSRKEGLPYSLLHSAALGIPTIATRVGGIPSFARECETIALIPKEDSHTLAEKIREYSVQPHVGPADHQACSLPEHFTLEAMARETKKLYESVLTTRES